MRNENQLEQKRRWFESYVENIGNGIRKPAKDGVRYTCPCCGYPTLSERGGYEICRLCDWEDDGQDDPDADKVYGGPNKGYSLTAARENFRKHLIMYAVNDNRYEGPVDSEKEKEAKKAIMAAFDEMWHAKKIKSADELWAVIRQNEATLDGELNRKIEE